MRCYNWILESASRSHTGGFLRTERFMDIVDRVVIRGVRLGKAFIRKIVTIYIDLHATGLRWIRYSGRCGITIVEQF